jgi:signal-transduction protein with cAMP-binding, CBS, and nucleotidyltransferase domain
MKLQDVMVAEVVQVSPEDSIGEAAAHMREKSVDCLVATVDGAIKGILTRRDLIACLAQRHDPYRCKIAQHMNRPVIVLRPEEELATAIEVMQKKRIRRVPVAAAGTLLGMISLSDAAAVLAPELEHMKSLQSFASALVKTQAAQSRVKSTISGNVP